MVAMVDGAIHDGPPKMRRRAGCAGSIVPPADANAMSAGTPICPRPRPLPPPPRGQRLRRPSFDSDIKPMADRPNTALVAPPPGEIAPLRPRRRDLRHPRPHRRPMAID